MEQNLQINAVKYQQMTALLGMQKALRKLDSDFRDAGRTYRKSRKNMVDEIDRCRTEVESDFIQDNLPGING